MTDSNRTADKLKEEIAHLEEMESIHTQVIYQLEKQAAYKGLFPEPHVVIQINEISHKLKEANKLREERTKQLFALLNSVDNDIEDISKSDTRTVLKDIVSIIRDMVTVDKNTSSMIKEIIGIISKMNDTAANEANWMHDSSKIIANIIKAERESAKEIARIFAKEIDDNRATSIVNSAIIAQLLIDVAELKSKKDAPSGD